MPCEGRNYRSYSIIIENYLCWLLGSLFLTPFDSWFALSYFTFRRLRNNRHSTGEKKPSGEKMIDQSNKANVQLHGLAGTEPNFSGRQD